MTRPLLIERPVRVPLCKLKNTERLSQISLFSVTTVSLSLTPAPTRLRPFKNSKSHRIHLPAATPEAADDDYGGGDVGQEDRSGVRCRRGVDS